LIDLLVLHLKTSNYC